MPRNKLLKTLVLLPASKIYGFVVATRNLMFKWHILKQREFPVPVVVVGNMAVGGTGKTPHTEYVIELLRNKYHLGVLSRGYKRRTKGFVLASRRSTPLDIGDEPYQIFQKYGANVTVAVCEDRCAGIEEMLRIDPKINLVILDDAFQHRYVKPTVSVVLTEFNRPIFYDKLLPLGRLREPFKSIYRANIVVVTKCPNQLKPLEYRIFKNNLKLYPYQKLFFSSFDYGKLVPLFPDEADPAPYLNWLTPDDAILAVAGIANPKPFFRYVRSSKVPTRTKTYPDHYNFTRRDLDQLLRRFDQLEGRRKILVTTEKDAVRLMNNPYFPHQLKKVAYYLPVKVHFDPHTESQFDIELQKQIVENSPLSARPSTK